MVYDKNKLNVILKTARRLIESDAEKYICHSLDKIYREAIHDEIWFIKETISTRLNGVYSYETWVINNCKEYNKKKIKHKAMLKQGRLNWIDSLIEEFSV